MGQGVKKEPSRAGGGKERKTGGRGGQQEEGAKLKLSASCRKSVRRWGGKIGRARVGRKTFIPTERKRTFRKKLGGVVVVRIGGKLAKTRHPVGGRNTRNSCIWYQGLRLGLGKEAVQPNESPRSAQLLVGLKGTRIPALKEVRHCRNRDTTMLQH